MIIKLAVLAVAVSVCALSLKKSGENFAVLVLVAGSVVIAAICIGFNVKIIGEIEDIFTYTGLDFAYFKILLKCLGVCLITQFSSDICNDASHTALSGQIVLAGKIIIIVISLPIFKSVLEIVSGMIKG